MTRPDPSTAPLIRHATRDDVDVLCRLGATTFRETYRTISDPHEVDQYADRHFSAENVRSWLLDAGARTLLALAAGAPVGYAHVRRATVPDCVADREAIQLSRLYLLASAQGAGLGGALLAAAIAEAAALGGRTVWLGAYDRNAKALAFYARRGFVQAGTHAFEFGGRIYADPVLTRDIADIADVAHGPTIIRASQNIPRRSPR